MSTRHLRVLRWVSLPSYFQGQVTVFVFKDSWMYNAQRGVLNSGPQNSLHHEEVTVRFLFSKQAASLPSPNCPVPTESREKHMDSDITLLGCRPLCILLLLPGLWGESDCNPVLVGVSGCAGHGPCLLDGVGNQAATALYLFKSVRMVRQLRWHPVIDRCSPEILGNHLFSR